MSTPHDRRHEEIVRDLFLGEIERDDPGAVSLLGSCAECRALLAEVEAAGLDGSAELEDSGSHDEGGSADVGALLAGIAAAEPYGRAPSRRWLLVAAAALVIGLLSLLPLYLGGERDDDPIFIGSGEIELLEPNDGVEEFTRFTWRCEREDVGSYTLRIYDETGGPGGPLHLERTHLKESTWTPTAEERRALPARIGWEVEAYGAFGPTGDPLASSSLRSSWLD